jgi:hypothetical protein
LDGAKQEGWIPFYTGGSGRTCQKIQENASKDEEIK